MSQTNLIPNKPFKEYWWGQQLKYDNKWIFFHKVWRKTGIFQSVYALPTKERTVCILHAYREFLLNRAWNLCCRFRFIVVSTWVANDYRKLLTGFERMHMGRRILNPSDNGKCQRLRRPRHDEDNFGLFTYCKDDLIIEIGGTD